MYSLARLFIHPFYQLFITEALSLFVHCLCLQVCLGEDAKEESNVVEVTAMNHQGKTISVPIANLHVNCLPMVQSPLSFSPQM